MRSIERRQSRFFELFISLKTSNSMDGRIDNAFYDQVSAQWWTEQLRLLREIERDGQYDEFYVEDGAKLLEPARNAGCLFVHQAPTRRNDF